MSASGEGTSHPVKKVTHPPWEYAVLRPWDLHSEYTG